MATNQTHPTPPAAAGKTAAAAPSHPAQHPAKAGGDLKQRLEDAMSSQTLTPDQQEKLGKLLDSPPSDAKELAKKFREIVPKGSLYPGQGYNVDVILAELQGQPKPTPPPGVDVGEKQPEEEAAVT